MTQLQQQLNPNLFIGHKVLITTREWFIAPNGISYKGVYGTLRAILPMTKDLLGFDVSKAHTNWAAQVGEMIIMGCQVLYCIKSDSVNLDSIDDWKVIDKLDQYNGTYTVKYNRPSNIYNAEPSPNE